MERVYDLNKLIEDAKVRWLKPIEVLFILEHYQYIGFTSKPPQKPSSGKLFIFNKRVNRYFRNDGHSWQKKKGGKTLAEGHEKLKVDNRDVLQCYYTQGHETENPHLRRRIFWMLDPAFEHIVLVHYREYHEEKGNPSSQILNFSSGSYSTPTRTTTLNNPSQNITSDLTGDLTGPAQYSSSSTDEVCSHFLTPPTIEDHLDNFYGVGADKALTISNNTIFEEVNALNNNTTFGEDAITNNTTFGDDTITNNTTFAEETNTNNTTFGEETITNNTTFGEETITNNTRFGEETNTNNSDGEDCEEWVLGYERLEELELSPEYEAKETKGVGESKDLLEDLFQDFNEGDFNEVKENSDGHMSGCTEEAAQNNNAIMLMNSDNWWMEKLQFDETETLIPSEGSLLIQKPMCTIREISPEWTFAHETTKVIIIGDFPINPSELSLQFGEQQLPLELIQQGVLKCWAPLVSNARTINLQLIDNNTGEPCCESLEFSIRENPNYNPNPSSSQSSYPNPDEQDLLVKLANTYLFGEKLENPNKLSNFENLVGEFVKDKLENWVLNKRVENDLGGFVLPKKDHGIIHLIASLGYNWGVKLLLDSGVNVNYRDPKGWTALHWAARFGREETVVLLVLSGASPEAVSDPTCHIEGRTAGAIADLYGHKGIAAFLSEAKLTSHPYASDQKPTNQKALHTIQSRKVHTGGATEDQLSLKDSLEGVRNVVQAATRIQQAFRNYSFRTKRENVKRYERENSSYLLSSEEMNEIGSRVCEKAAVSIQKNFRCWKKRKEFVKLRRNVVKIQSHYRAHQARKYKNLLSTVSILEKVVLRWYKKGVGLRGYQPDPLRIDREDESDILKAFRKQKVEKEINEAVSRVLSVVDAPEARQQYRRMLAGYQLAKGQLKKLEN